MSLREKIEQEISQGGPIPFSRYMELCLYDPELGYYSRQAEKFGKAGDFYTASDVHAVFGRLLARQFDEMWRALGSSGRIEVVELGPGRGLFARDVLAWSEKKFPDFFRALEYRLVERSASLCRRLEITLERHVVSGKARVEGQWDEADGRDAPRFAGSVGGLAGRGVRTHEEMSMGARAASPVIVFANEFFDALPVEVLSRKGSLRVDLREGRFVEAWVPASLAELEFLDRYGVHPEAGERVEAPLAALGEMKRIASRVQHGFAVIIDYGYTRDQQLAGRHRGTIMSYREHRANPNPYAAPGEQDLTAHVNFTALAAAAGQQGFRTQKLHTQSTFLMGIGEANQFADAFEECRLPQERAKVALQLKHLVTPAGLGETFHVLVASKGVNESDVLNLSGLRFGRGTLEE